MLALAEKTLDELIEILLDKTVIAIDDGKNSGQIKPQKQTLFKWISQDFEYTDEGVKNGGFSGNRIEKENWSNNSSKIVFTRLLLSGF